MIDSQNRPAFASVLYLRLAQFSGKPVTEQARLRRQLETVVAAALLAVPEPDRLVLDAMDGLTIVVLSGPATAFEIAERCLASAAAPPICAGLNFGPVVMVSEAETWSGLMGDGIAAALVAAGFAQPQQMLATRAFRDALSAQAPDRDAELQAAGTYSDASVRTYELFVGKPGATDGRRRRLLLASLLWSALILGLAMIARVQLGQYGLLAPPAVLVFDITPLGEVFVDGKRVGTAPPLQQLELRAGPHSIEVRRDSFASFKQEVDLKPGDSLPIKHAFQPPAILLLDIAPAGEVFVGGKSRGQIPDLKRLELPAGAHRLEVRLESFPPLTLDLQLESGREFRVWHIFARPARVAFDVQPAADVYVDGAYKGKTADLAALELPAGEHLIELRHKNFPSLKRKLNLKPEERYSLKHRFKAPASWTDKIKDVFGVGQ